MPRLYENGIPKGNMEMKKIKEYEKLKDYIINDHSDYVCVYHQTKFHDDMRNDLTFGQLDDKEEEKGE